MAISRYFDSAESLDIRPFISRLIRRCRTIPDFITFKMFEETDALRSAIEKLNRELEEEHDYQMRLKAEAVEDQQRLVRIAEDQCKRLDIAEKDAIEMHKALMLAYDAKVFWQKQCYLLTHFSDWERGMPEEENVQLSNMRNFFDYGAQVPTTLTRATHAGLQRTILPMRGAQPVTVSRL